MRKLSNAFKNINPITLSIGNTANMKSIFGGKINRHLFSTNIFSQSIMTKNMINKFPQKMAFSHKIVSRDTEKMKKMFVKTEPTIKHVGTLPTNSIKIRNYMSNEEMEETTLWCSGAGAVIGAVVSASVTGPYASFGEIALLAMLGALAGILIGLVWFISIPVLILAGVVALVFRASRKY